MDLVISVIFPVLTVIIGGACILLFSVTTTLRASNSDLTARVDFLEKERDRLELEKRTDRETFDAKLVASAGELEALRKVVTGEAHLVAISDLLTEHHSEALAQWANVTTTLGHVDQTLEHVASALEERVTDA